MKKFIDFSLAFSKTAKRFIIPVNVFLIFLLFSANTFGQYVNSFQEQSFNTPENKSPANFTAHNTESPKWETIQSVEIKQPLNSGNFGFSMPPPPVKINLDQVRNGSGTSRITPANWVNGNAGASNAHFVEGWSIPYRAVFTDLAVGTSRSIDIEWDIKHSGANAIDFITHYDLINFPAGSHATNFSHLQEEINPLIGFETLGFGFPGQTDIPIPNLPSQLPIAPGAAGTYAAIQAAAGNKDAFSIFGGTITGLTYISQGNLASSSASTRLRITFTNTSTTVILSWGGHIAKGTDWGLGKSAAAVSGSPYHTRLISWDLDGDGLNQTEIGNQDRSLSADAVVDPPACTLGGPASVECSTQNIYTTGLSSTDVSGFTYGWTLPVNTSGASIVSTDTYISATVNSGTGCGTSYTVRFTIYKNNIEVSRCEKVVTVQDTQAPTITCPTAPTSPINCPATPVFVTATATDNCDASVAVTFTDADVAGTCAGTYTRTRTWTATDDCGNTSTCSQSVVVRDITPPTITCPADLIVECGNPTSTAVLGSATATDECSTPIVTASDVTSTVGCQTVITRTWTATDGCGNTASCVQRILVIDRTPPVITCNNGSATATDNCGAFYLYQNGTTWTAMDASGNVSTATCTAQRSANTQQSEPTNTVTGEAQKAVITENKITPVQVSELKVRAFPNPYTDQVNFRFVSPKSGSAKLELYDMVGKLLGVIDIGNVIAGIEKSINYKIPELKRNSMIYKLTVGNQTGNGLLISGNKEP